MPCHASFLCTGHHLQAPRWRSAPPSAANMLPLVYVTPEHCSTAACVCCPAPVPPVQLAWPTQQGAKAQPWVMRWVLAKTLAMPHSISSPCLADVVIALGRQSPSSFYSAPGPSSPSIPGFTSSCAVQPPRRANLACLCFTRRSVPAPRTMRLAAISVCEPKLTATSGLALRVLPPLSRCLGLGGGWNWEPRWFLTRLPFSVV
jgi:hypothetical protein